MNASASAANAIGPRGVTLLLFAVWTLVGLQRAQAGLVFDVENVTVEPGQVAHVGVFVHATGAEQLYDYDLTIDIGMDGFGLPPGLAGLLPGMIDDGCAGCLLSSDVVVSGFKELPLPFVQNYEAVFSDNGLGSVDLASGPVRLFDLLIQTEVGWVGTIPIGITANSLPNRFHIVSSVGTFSQATAELLLLAGAVTAVPEPSAFLAVGAVSLLVTLNGWSRAVRRRRSRLLGRSA